MVSCEGIQDFLVDGAFATSLGFCIALKTNRGPFEGLFGVGLPVCISADKVGLFRVRDNGKTKGREKKPAGTRINAIGAPRE
jgi:hypothetical protein